MAMFVREMLPAHCANVILQAVPRIERWLCLHRKINQKTQLILSCHAAQAANNLNNRRDDGPELTYCLFSAPSPQIGRTTALLYKQNKESNERACCCDRVMSDPCANARHSGAGLVPRLDGDETPPRKQLCQGTTKGISAFSSKIGSSHGPPKRQVLKGHQDDVSRIL